MLSDRAGPSAGTGRRRKVAARTRLDFWFDTVILVGYTVAYSYGFTGVVIHEWLGIALGVALLLHIVLIGVAWHHFAPGSFGGQGGTGPHRFVVRGQPATAVPRGVKVLPGGELNSGGTSGIPPIQLGEPLEPVNLAVLWNTAWIEAAVIAAVVIVDAGLRKRRRARRRPSR